MDEQRAVDEVQNKDDERQVHQQNEGELRYQQSEEQQPIGEKEEKMIF